MNPSTMSHQDKPAIAVIGAGTMGRGIIQLFAQAGHPVHCFDAVAGAATKAVQFVIEMIQRGVDKGRISQGDVDAIAARLKPCEQITELAGCELVIEAVVEDLAVKRALFQSLENVVASTATLASNTSSLMIAELAAGCRHPERVAGLHFFNPVPLMRVVEVIAAVRTAPAVVEGLAVFVNATGHRAVIAADQPGFLVNHAGRGYYTEALRVLEEQAASVVEIDTVLREAAGFRMGPFELLDLTGLDVSGKVMESIYEQFQHEPRFRPSALVRPRIAAGLHGRKTGEGWYRYENGQQIVPAAREIPALAPGLKVWIDPAADQHDGLAALLAERGAALEAVAGRADLLLVQFWGIDATRYCVEQGLDAHRCVAIDPLPGLDRHRTLMLTTVTTAAARDAALALLAGSAPGATLIGDSPGFITQRVLATIVNIACNIAQRGIARVADIEAAVKLGLGYPLGPLAWGDAIGAPRLLAILEGMQACTFDPRYRPSPWLTRRVALGLSLRTEEAGR